MYVDEIDLKDFRSYEKGYARFERGTNIIYGANARGKTNILEAVFLLCFARSHRFAREGEMIRHGCDFARINSKFSSRGRNFESEIKLFAHKKKQIKINKVPIDKTSDLMGYLNVVMFCPEDLRIVKGAPRERRRMMDFGICQISKKYFFALSQYVKVAEQRNRLLRENPKSDALWVWDEKLATFGSEIIFIRRAFIDLISKHAAAALKQISGEVLDVIYTSGANTVDFSSVEKIKEQFFAELKRNAEREKSLGVSLIGPHRDDFSVSINLKDAKTFASQGQQRTAVLALKMAEVAVIKEKIGESPILLLDDVLSELDKSRRTYIMENIKDMQVIISCTAVPGGTKANVINVEDVKI